MRFVNDINYVKVFHEKYCSCILRSIQSHEGCMDACSASTNNVYVQKQKIETFSGKNEWTEAEEIDGALSSAEQKRVDEGCCHGNSKHVAFVRAISICSFLCHITASNMFEMGAKKMSAGF